MCTVNKIGKSAGFILPKELWKFLNPNFLNFYLPLGLAKWVWAIFWAMNVSVIEAGFALFIVWIVGVVAPIPIKLTMPPIYSQIRKVISREPEFGELLWVQARNWHHRP
jgi:hypothetical protein